MDGVTKICRTMLNVSLLTMHLSVLLVCSILVTAMVIVLLTLNANRALFGEKTETQDVAGVYRYEKMIIA